MRGPLVSKHRREKNLARLDMEINKVLLLDPNTTVDYSRKRQQYFRYAAIEYCTLHPELKEKAVSKNSNHWSKRALCVVRAHFVDRLCSGNFDTALTEIMADLSPLLTRAMELGFFPYKPLDQTSVELRKADSKAKRKLTETGARERKRWSNDELAAFEEGLKLFGDKVTGKFEWTKIATIKILSDNGRTNQDCRDKYKSLYLSKQKLKKTKNQTVNSNS